MTIKTLVCAGVLLLGAASGLAQSRPKGPRQEVASDDWKERGLTLGLSKGRYLFAEAGHYRSLVYRMGVLPIFSSSLNYGCEFAYLDKLVVAPKVQARIHVLFFDVSLAPVLYTDFSKASLKLRPEIGLGNNSFDLNYGYNLGLVNNSFDQLNRHMISLRYYWCLKKRARHEYDHQGQLMRRQK